MQTVFIAGATGYLGRYLCAEYRQHGWYVMALVRDATRAADLDADALIEAQATDPMSLRGMMDDVDLVVSALGITRQRDGLGYQEVDYGANLNLLREAERAQVARFAYVHVLNAEQMPGVALVAAKSAFVRALQESAIASTVIAPSGYFSDMGDFLSLARSGRVWLFGAGDKRINPIHGADLAQAIAEATDAGRAWLDVGGPGSFSHMELAQLAFETLGTAQKVTRLPDLLRRITLTVLPWATPRRIHGPAQFFLSAMGIDMVGDPHGARHLRDHFAQQAELQKPSKDP